MGIRDRPISPRSPWQNPYAERLIGTLRRDARTRIRSPALEMVQLRVNLPAKDKNAEPGYQLLDQDIPSVELQDGAGTLRVIAGDCDGHRGPAHTFTLINFFGPDRHGGSQYPPWPLSDDRCSKRHNAMIVLEFEPRAILIKKFPIWRVILPDTCENFPVILRRNWGIGHQVFEFAVQESTDLALRSGDSTIFPVFSLLAGNWMLRPVRR